MRIKSHCVVPAIKTLNPHYQSLYLYLAEALQEEEQLEEAKAVIEEGITENPFQVELYQFASENAYRLRYCWC